MPVAIFAPFCSDLLFVTGDVYSADRAATSVPPFTFSSLIFSLPRTFLMSFCSEEYVRSLPYGFGGFEAFVKNKGRLSRGGPVPYFFLACFVCKWEDFLKRVHPETKKKKKSIKKAAVPTGNNDHIDTNLTQAHNSEI